MKTKTFKIGEYAIGGLIKIEHKENNSIKVQFLDWDTKKPVPFTGVTIDLTLISINSTIVKNKLREVLEDGTTSYYSDKVLEYIYKQK